MADSLPLVAHAKLTDRVQAMERDGYAYFPALLEEEEVARLRAAMGLLQPLEASFDRDQTVESGGFINKSVNNAFNRDPLFLQYLDKPGVIELAEAVHGEDCHVIGMTAWMTGPGRPDQNLHTDWQPLTLPKEVMADPRVKVPIFITTAHFYLDDIDQELGPTNFVPGSHLSGRTPQGDVTWQGGGEQSILCRAGDVVLFRCEVWHRGTANRSKRTRYLLQVHYAKRMITQKFPPYLNRFQFDPEFLDRATPRQLRLLGDHGASNYD